MQLTESHRQYWRKNLNITAVLDVYLVCGDVRRELFRARSEFQLFRMAIQFLDGRARIPDRSTA
jgi:hypothetical protein